MIATWLAIRTKLGPNSEASIGDWVDAFGPDRFSLSAPIPATSVRSFIGIEIAPETAAQFDSVKINMFATSPAENILFDPPQQIAISRCHIEITNLPQAAQDELTADRITVVDWADIKDMIWDRQNARFLTMADL